MCRFRQCAILQVPVELFSGNYVEICGKKYSLRSIGVFRRLYERQNQVKTGSAGEEYEGESPSGAEREGVSYHQRGLAGGGDEVTSPPGTGERL